VKTASILVPNDDKTLTLLQREVLLCLRWAFCLTVL